MGAFLEYRGALYQRREASWLDTAVAWVLKPVWGLAAKLGWSKQDIKKAFSQAWRTVSRRADAVDLPDEIIEAVAEVLASRGILFADFMHALGQQLEHPPAGYRWRVDAFGSETLIKVGHETEESSLVRGERFRDAIFIGCWWTTNVPKGSANRKMQNLLHRLDGDTFWQAKYGETGLRQYGGFCVVPRLQADAAAQKICAAAEAVDQEGGGEHRLSAVSLIGAAMGREIQADDQVKLSCINSLKWNWRWNLTDLLMGRITDFRSSGKLDEFLTELRKYRSRKVD